MFLLVYFLYLKNEETTLPIHTHIHRDVFIHQFCRLDEGVERCGRKYLLRGFLQNQKTRWVCLLVGIGWIFETKQIWKFVWENIYRQGDCKLFRFKYLSYVFHKEPMGGGSGETINKLDKEWNYPSPESSFETVLKSVCAYAK